MRYIIYVAVFMLFACNNDNSKQKKAEKEMKEYERQSDSIAKDIERREAERKYQDSVRKILK